MARERLHDWQHSPVIFTRGGPVRWRSCRACHRFEVVDADGEAGVMRDEYDVPFIVTLDELDRLESLADGEELVTAAGVTFRRHGHDLHWQAPGPLDVALQAGVVPLASDRGTPYVLAFCQADLPLTFGPLAIPHWPYLRGQVVEATVPTVLFADEPLQPDAWAVYANGMRLLHLPCELPPATAGGSYSVSVTLRS